MKFLICGLGSIGQRHFKNLKSLGCDQIAVYRTFLGSDNPAVNALLLEYAPPQFNDLQEALKTWKPDVVLVTNPTSLHVPVALEAAKAGCHLLIEKPVWHRLGPELDELLAVVDAKKLKVAVAYHWRFNWFLQTLRDWMTEFNGRVGFKPISVRASVGEQVADWHFWEDHRVSYACRKDLGGGVILTLSHDLDMLYWLFGKPEKVLAVGGNLVHKDIDVEDTAEIVMRFKGGPVAYLHMDYWQPERTREMKILCEGHRFDWRPNYVAGWLYENDGPFREHCGPDQSEETRNKMHLDMLKHFLAAIDGGPMDPLCDLWQAVDVLDMALAAKNQIYVPRGDRQ